MGNSTTIIENQLSRIAVDSALSIHRELGPGLLESAYERVHVLRIKKKRCLCWKAKSLPLVYDDIKLEIGYRLDLILENKLIIEIKSVEALNDVHLAQVLTYLKLSNCKLGLLINFNVALIKHGIKRVINGTL